MTEHFNTAPGEPQMTAGPAAMRSGAHSGKNNQFEKETKQQGRLYVTTPVDTTS